MLKATIYVFIVIHDCLQTFNANVFIPIYQPRVSWHKNEHQACAHSSTRPSHRSGFRSSILQDQCGLLDCLGSSPGFQTQNSLSQPCWRCLWRLDIARKAHISPLSESRPLAHLVKLKLSSVLNCFHKLNLGLGSLHMESDHYI